MENLNEILTLFRPLFNSQNYHLFCAFIAGLILCPGRKTTTRIYQASGSNKRYWSFVKFLSRSKWDTQALAIMLLERLQSMYKDWLYIYDETHAVKTGKRQFGLHFFRNHKYQKRNRNQSKFHWRHQFAALGLLCLRSVVP